MFGSQVLDIAIGFVFVFLLVSSLVTIVNETIASFWSSSRAKWLSKGMDRLLDPTWATKLFAHPLIDGSAPTQGGKPTYIPSRSFANVLLDIVRKESAELTPIKQALQAALGAPADASNASITLSVVHLVRLMELLNSAPVENSLVEARNRWANEYQI